MDMRRLEVKYMHNGQKSDKSAQKIEGWFKTFWVGKEKKKSWIWNPFPYLEFPTTRVFVLGLPVTVRNIWPVLQLWHRHTRHPSLTHLSHGSNCATWGIHVLINDNGQKPLPRCFCDVLCLWLWLILSNSCPCYPKPVLQHPENSVNYSK